MTPVDLSTVHHEGGGAPRDDLAAPGTKGYVVGIGLTRYTFFRPPDEAFATFNFNHVSFDVLFSGDRDIYPITNNDLLLLADAADNARSRGWLVDQPYVRPHRNSPGSNTICPGNKAAYPDAPSFPVGDALAWVGIVTALHKETPPMPPQVSPQFFPAIGPFVSWCIFTHPTLGRCAAAVDNVGHVFCDPPESYMGSPYDDHTHLPKSYWGTRHAATITAAPGGGYAIEDTAAENYGPRF